MAILGFPSSAIIGDLDWTGTNVDLAASDFVQIFGYVGTQITAPGPIADSSINVTSSNGVTLSTDDESSLLRLNVNAGGIIMATDGPMNIGSTANVSVNATETLNITGGNLISGGVSITTPQVLNLGGETRVEINSQQGIYLTAPSVDGTLGLNLGNGIAELHVDDGASYVSVISDGEGVEIKGAGFLFVNAPLFQHNGANVATQPFSIAMAIALG